MSHFGYQKYIQEEERKNYRGRLNNELLQRGLDGFMQWLVDERMKRWDDEQMLAEMQAFDDALIQKYLREGNP